ncbi:MAG: hypothetical protein KDE09_01610 [Anaerolineales bacterium]|nr:hypothetical protein [Anaerolineales bacterium]MCB0028357.1 hypothetical protein [Anaerolineales bacterium]
MTTLGQLVAVLLDLETVVTGVAVGTVPAHLRVVAAPHHSDKVTLNPAVPAKTAS